MLVLNNFKDFFRNLGELCYSMGNDILLCLIIVMFDWIFIVGWLEFRVFFLIFKVFCSRLLVFLNLFWFL